MNETSFSTNNKKIIEFYNSYEFLNFEKVNLLFVELFESIFNDDKKKSNNNFIISKILQECSDNKKQLNEFIQDNENKLNNLTNNFIKLEKNINDFILNFSKKELIDNEIPKELIDNQIPKELIDNQIPKELIDNQIPKELIDNEIPKEFYSQYEQDKYLEENIFKGFKNGFFIDIGAHDGISLNNTLYFEKYNNWIGINIEPIKSVYDKLIINRPKNNNINCAICNFDGETEFICNTGYTEMISGIKDYFDPRHFERLQNENRDNGSESEIIKVITKRLETICDENNISHINYISIDVEGAEFEVIKSINFEKVFVDVIEFENNYNDTSIPIVNYLENKNFVVIHKDLDIFMINKNSTFYVK